MPVYNAQAYLDSCIHSVLNQPFQDLELILVDDGSTDDSLQICRRRASDPRVRVISTENRGVSSARNTGLQHASGKWILFLDSDDSLLDGALERLMAMATADTDLLIGTYTEDLPEPNRPLCERVSADSLRTMTLDPINHRLLPDFYEVKPMSLCACWGKLYRADVIRKNDIRFHEALRLSEDTLFNLDYLACIDHGILANVPVVHYRHNAGSVTKVFSEKHLTNRFRFFDLLLERAYPEAAVHILSLLFFEICKIEQSAPDSRTGLQQQIVRYLSAHPAILHDIKHCALSAGTYQRLVYQAAAGCFRVRAYWAGFALLRAYTAAILRR